jgi:hypothetical protein
MKRFAILVAVASCFHDSSTSLSNEGGSGASNDVLAMLPMNSEIVFGVDVAASRSTQLWSRFEPRVVHEVKKDLDELTAACGFDPITTTRQVTGGIKFIEHGRVSGVIVARGVPAKVLDCVMTHFGKGGDNAKRDHGVVLYREGDQESAWSIVGTDTLVIELAPAVTADSMAHVIASGSPLRSSPHFLAIFDRLDHSAQTWAVVNGSSSIMNDFHDGPRPKTIDGTLKASDRLVLAARFEMAEPADATRFHALISKDLDRAAGFMQVHTAKVTGSAVTLDVELTGDQIENALALLGFH